MTGVTRKLQASRAMRFLRLQVAGRFVRQNDGAAAIEFGLVAAPFLALVFAILETALVFFAGQTLETAAADSARLVMTGQAQAQGFDQGKFKTEVCKRIYALFDCAGTPGVQVDVRKYTSFAAVEANPTDIVYNPGGPGDVVVVRLSYQFPVYVSLLGLNSGAVNGKRPIVATAAFRNEPYAN